jgi:hypothetical protein
MPLSLPRLVCREQVILLIPEVAANSRAPVGVQAVSYEQISGAHLHNLVWC